MTAETDFDTSYLRNKLEISYPNKSKFTPYISGDLFYEIGAKIDQIRPKAGVSYKFAKHHTVDVSVFSNVDLVGTESSGTIIGLGYKFKFLRFFLRSITIPNNGPIAKNVYK